MKSYKWFRFYNDVLNDFKVQSLPPEMFKAWINVLCLASKGDGKIRNNATLQWSLRKSVDETKAILNCLDGAGLLEFHNDHFVPHNWGKWQYKSDTSTDRVKQFRKRKRNVSVTPPDTESDTDTESKIIPLRGKKESGNSRKTPIPEDWKPNQHSIDAAKGLGLSEVQIEREALKFRHHAKQNDRRTVRWNSAFDNWCVKATEYLNISPPTQKIKGFSALPGSPEFAAWRTHARDCGKASLVRILDQREMEGRAFEFESQWPPGVSNHAVG